MPFKNSPVLVEEICPPGTFLPAPCGIIRHQLCAARNHFGCFHISPKYSFYSVIYDYKLKTVFDNYKL